MAVFYNYLEGENKTVQCSVVGIPGQLPGVQHIKKHKQIIKQNMPNVSVQPRTICSYLI
jgi:hypothetical protein